MSRLRFWRNHSSDSGFLPIVLEILLGVLIGPQALDFARPDDLSKLVAQFGLVMLMFLAGFEVSLSRVKGRPIIAASVAWGGSALLAAGAVATLFSAGVVDHRMVVGLALTTTALTSLVPILRDAGILRTPLGIDILAIGSVGEFLPLIGLGFLIASSDPLLKIVLLLGFSAVAISAAAAATLPKPPVMVEFLRRHLDTSTQLPVRIAILMILVLMLLADSLGVDLLLGAFTAGLVIHLFTDKEDRPDLDVRFGALGYGFFIPVFFVSSGMNLDLSALFGSWGTVLRIPLFLVALLLVRGLPTWFSTRGVRSVRERIALGLFASTGLSLIVAITAVGAANQLILPENAAALVGAGMLSMLLFPSIGLSILGKSEVGPVGIEPTTEGL